MHAAARAAMTARQPALIVSAVLCAAVGYRYLQYAEPAAVCRLALLLLSLC
jgi:hypothetical protein